MVFKKLTVLSLSYPARGMWIEIDDSLCNQLSVRSYPARGMWIEIYFSFPRSGHTPVVPREGYVD